MGWMAILGIGLAAWLLWTGRLQRMTAKDGVALGVAIIGAVMAAKGKPLAALVPLLASTGFFLWQNKIFAPKQRQKQAMDGTPADIADARALLGVADDADADTIRQAHRRLIASVHPDRGGTQALAAKINAARDLLLRYQAM